MLKDQLLTIRRFHCMLFLAFPLLLLIFFSLYLIFDSLINMCLGMFPLGLILYRTLWASWTCLTISFPMVGKFSTINSSNIFSARFFYSSSSGSPIIWMLMRLMLSQSSLKLSSILFILFSFSALWQLFPPLYLSGHLSVLLSQLLCYWFLVGYFKFQLLCCSSLFVCSLVF